MQGTYQVVHRDLHGPRNKVKCDGTLDDFPSSNDVSQWEASEKVTVDG